MKDYSFEIIDFEPYFLNTFKVVMPNNLKPPRVELKYLNLSDEVLLDFESFEKISKEIQSQNNLIGSLYLKEELNEAKFQEFKRKKYPIYWLANSIGKENLFRGLTVEGLKALPNGLYQIGQEESNTKGYFRYTSVSIKRRISIRLEVWSQYRIKLHRSEERQKGISIFFQSFELFEDEIKHEVESIFLFYDEYTDKLIELQLKNGCKISKELVGSFNTEKHMSCPLHLKRR